MSLEEAYRRIYPFNLIYAIFQPANAEDFDFIGHINLAGIMEATKTLHDREQKVLELRFRQGLTLKETGAEFGVTTERIRQIEAKALRKMRHPSRWKQYRMIEMEKLWEAEKAVSGLELENLTLRRKLDGIEAASPAPPPTPTPPKPEVYLDEMNLSVRSFNCLRRAGYDKLSDLAGVKMSELAVVRNLGKRSLEEIVAKLKEYGVEMEG